MITRNEIKVNYLNIEIDDSTFDDIIDYYILIAKDEIKRICGQSIEQETIDYYFKHEGTEKLVPYINTTLLNDLYEKTEVSDEWAEVEGILFKDSSIKIHYDFSGFYKANITYGYTVVPSDIKNVCGEMVYIMFEQVKINDGHLRGTLGLSQIAQTTDGLAGTFTLKDMNNWNRVLNKYKKLYD